MLTLAFVSGGYELASVIHASGPLTIVTAGLVIGTYGRNQAMSANTRFHIDIFWETLDEILNGILFVLIGLEVLVLQLEPGYLIVAACSIPFVLLARFVSLALPVAAIKFMRNEDAPLSILTWGGLRGGMSIALALSLPESQVRDVLLVCTYAAVAFSILVQATTMPMLLRAKLGVSKTT
jgi:monovalent cation:H+ antiporter, CPA1 family